MTLSKLDLDKLQFVAIAQANSIVRDFYQAFEGEPLETFPYQEVPDAENELLRQPTGKTVIPPQADAGLR